MTWFTKWRRKRRFKDRLEERLNVLQDIEAKASDAVQDRAGDFTISASGEYRRIGILEYIVSRNVLAFRTNLQKSIKLRLNYFAKFETVEQKDKSRFSMYASYQLFDAIASGDMQVSTDFARVIGGRPEIEKEYSSLPFVRAIGYAIKYAMLDDQEQWNSWGKRLIDICRNDPEYRNFLALAQMLDAIRRRDLGDADRAFEGFLLEYRAECKRNKFFFESGLDGDLCVWGIGLVNLCRWRGLRLIADSPIVPKELLVDA